MSQKWKSDKIIKFLEAYEQCRCLWDVHSNLYKNKLAREEAYLKMAKIVDIENLTVAKVKDKIRSLRNAYTLELTKITKSKKSGADEVYKPRVPWFIVADRILHQVVQIRKSQPTEIGIKIEDSEEDSASINLRNISHDEVVLPSSVDTVVPTPSTSRTTTLQSAPKKIKKTVQTNTDKALEELKLISNTLTQSLPNEDEYDFFGKSIACQLQKLPESVAVESMAFVQSYLSQQKLKVIKPPAIEPSSGTSSSTRCRKRKARVNLQ